MDSNRATSVPPSKWIKCISREGTIRGIAIQAAGLINEMAERHDLTGEGLKALGEATMGALMVASHCKAGERINLNIRATGIIQQALIDAHPEGTARGYVIERQFGAKKGDSGGPWGTGLLSVLRTKTREHEKPYIGTVPLLTGHLAKDLTFYWVQSEQIRSAVGLAVNLSPDGKKATAAGGFMIQALPGAQPAEIRAIESHINELESLATRLTEDDNPIAILSQIFQSTAFMIIEEKPLRFECQCSWKRVERALTLVGVSELKAMLKEDHQATVRCDFCAKEYQVSSGDLERLIEAKAS